jgi:CAAX protease family protein
VTQEPPLYAPPAPPPDPPEAPAGAEQAPRWPAWYGPVAFLTAFAVLFVLLVPIVYVVSGGDSDDPPAIAVILSTLMQSAVLVGAAVGFAAITARPRPWHFGLRPTRLWPAVGWAALGLLAFYVLAAVYSAALQPDVDQTVTDDLGADEGTLGLIVAGIMVILVAPAAEEFFFRGFFYRALRSRFSVFAAAAIDGLLFGVIHWDFSSAEGLLLIPPLGMLGFIFCLVYERTGSLYPVIALHAFNNSLAYGAQEGAWEVSAVLGPVMLASCVLVPRLFPSGPRPATT